MKNLNIPPLAQQGVILWLINLNKRDHLKIRLKCVKTNKETNKNTLKSDSLLLECRNVQKNIEGLLVLFCFILFWIYFVFHFLLLIIWKELTGIIIHFSEKTFTSFLKWYTSTVLLIFLYCWCNASNCFVCTSSIPGQWWISMRLANIRKALVLTFSWGKEMKHWL